MHASRLNALTACLLWSVCGNGLAQDKANKVEVPATVEQATAVLDLAKMPLFAGAEEGYPRAMSSLTYVAPTSVAKAYDFHKQQLVKLKWKEVGDVYTSAETISATFERDGFRLTFSVNGAGGPEKSMVILRQHGNVNLKQLPLPADFKPFHDTPTNAIYLSEKTPEETMAACRESFRKDGWSLYGNVPDCVYVRKNAVIVIAFIGSAPAQMGKTMIQLHSELVSVDIPAPEQHDDLRYTDAPTQLYFESSLSAEELFKFYQTELAQRGWQATTDDPLETSQQKELIFRNPAKDMLTLRIDDVDGERKVMVEHARGEEIAAREARIKAELAAKSNKPAPQPMPSKKLAVKIPKEAREVEVEKDRISFKAPGGKAQAIVAAWRKEYLDAKWKDVASVLDGPAGSVTLSKDDATLTITYVDAGVIPTEITIDAFGIELERAKGKNDK